MAYTLGVLVLILGVTVSIALHEVGHLLPAKWFNVRVPRYMVGFGPTVWSRTRGETEYGIKAFPIGGYCRLIGMVPPASEVRPVRLRGWWGRLIDDTRFLAQEEITPTDGDRVFYRLTWWKKVVVMAGGPIMNLLIAVVILTGIGVFYGVPTTVPTASAITQCVLPADVDRECAAGDVPSPALAAGLEVGDQIVAVDGTTVEGWSSLVDYVENREGVPIDFTVVRDGAEIDLTATPIPTVRDDDGVHVLPADGTPSSDTSGFLGMAPSSVLVSQPLWWGIGETGTYVAATARGLVQLPELVWHAGRAAFGLEARDPEGFMSVVGIGRVAGEVAAASEFDLVDRIAGMFVMLAGLNIALFMFNLIPLSPLDGGYVVGGFWEGIKRGWARFRNRRRVGEPFVPRPVDLARTVPVTYVVVPLLVIMAAILIWADLAAPITLS